MVLPPREALLDVEWLIRTHEVEGTAALAAYVRQGAEVYGGPVTAVAEAILYPRLPFPPRWTDQTDARYALACKLLSGSWSPDPAGPAALKSNMHIWISTMSSALREKLGAKVPYPPGDWTVPNLHRLRLCSRWTVRGR